MAESVWSPHRSDRGPARYPPPLSRGVGRVLLVDDYVDAVELYGMYLVHRGYQTLTAGDGFMAFELALRFLPDVIVMDLSMPRMDGISSTKRLKEHRRTRNIPVILLTGFPERAINEQGLEAGADMFVTKPCLPEDLEQQIRRLMKATSRHTA